METTSAPKRSHWKTGKLEQKHELKRAEAQDRQAAHDNLSLRQKLEKAQDRGGSKREIVKLEKKISAQKVSQAKPAKLTEVEKSIKAVTRAQNCVVASPKPKAKKKHMGVFSNELKSWVNT